MSDLNRGRTLGADSTAASPAAAAAAVTPGPDSTPATAAHAAGNAGSSTAPGLTGGSASPASQGAQRRGRAANLRAARTLPHSNRARLSRIGIAAVITVTIFVLDALTTLDIAVAVLYVVVVLVAAPVCSQRSMLALCCALMLLTIAAFMMSHGSAYLPAPVGRGIVSLAAIGISGFLTLKNMAATEVLREQVQLLDLTSDAIVVFDMRRVIGYWNLGAQALYGFTADEAVGRATHELVRTEFPIPLAAIDAELMRTGRWEGELAQTRRDGSRVTVASRWSLRRDTQGQPVSVLITNNDITQRKRMESEIARQQQEIRAAIDAIPAMVWIASADGRMVFANERWSELGLTLDESGGNWGAFVHPDDLPQLESDWFRALEQGTAFENESRIRRGDGAYRWMLLRAAPLVGDDGRIVRWYGANSDIEERERAAEALARSESFLAEAETLSQTGSIGFALPDFSMFWSRQAYRIFEYADALEPSLERMLARVHPDDHARVASLLHTAATDLRDIDVEYRLQMPEPHGAVKQVHLVAHAIDTGHARGYRGALMDVTEARNVQDALHRSLAELAHVTRVTTLGELSASIAHEVSQPIAAIMTNGEAGLRWLQRQPPHLTEVHEALLHILRDAQRAGGIVQRIRALARKSAPNRVPFELNALIEESVVLVQREIGVHAIALELRLASGGLTIVGDRVQLQQVVINLMINAIQAMASTLGRPRRLTLRSSCDETGNGHEVREVRVSVEDSGPGIAEADLLRLFQPFFTTREEGMGMGLSICRSIVESHGGRIHASAQPGQGAVVTFVLPGCTPARNAPESLSTSVASDGTKV